MGGGVPGAGGIVASSGPAATARGLDPNDPPSPAAGREILLGLPLFGIPPREGRLYLALEGGGTMSAREATESSHLHRATAYRLLLRLLRAGLIRSDGRSPQRFQAVPFDLVSKRSLSYFDDEEDLRRELVLHYAHLTAPPRAERCPHGESQVVSLRRPSSHTVLRELGRAHREVDVVLRSLAAPPEFRGEVARAIAQAVDRDVRVRLILDVSPSERRFLSSLRRELHSPGTKLEVRHLCPLASHLYLIDSRRAIRFSVLGNYQRTSDAGYLTTEMRYVRSQAARFEAMWAEAVPTFPSRSTRSFGWVPRAPPSGHAPVAAPDPWRARPAHV